MEQVKVLLIGIVVFCSIQCVYCQTLSPILPANNVVLENTIVHFSWNSLSFSEDYILQLSSDSLFSLNTQDYSTGTATEIYLNLDGGTYYWRAKSLILNSWYYSAVRKFSVINVQLLGDLELWLKSDTGVVINGTNQIYKWQDQSGKGNDMIQPVSNQRPLLVTNQLNGHDIVRFDGIMSSLKSESFFDLSATQAITVFVVLKFTFLDNPDRVVYQLGADFNTTTNGFAYFKNSFITEDVQLKGDIGYNTFRSTQQMSTDYYIHTAFFNKSLPINEVGLYRNGHLLLGVFGNIQNNNNTFANDYFMISNSSVPNMNKFPGDIAEVLIFGNALTLDEQQLVESYLNYKYAGPPVNIGNDINKTYGFCDTIIDAGPYATSYLWSTGATTRTIPVNNGKFWVKTDNLFNYQSSDTIIVKYPDIRLTRKDTTLCFGDSIFISANCGNNYSFLWSNGSTDTGIFVKNTLNVHTIIMDTSGCISKSDTIFILIDDFSRIATLGNDTSICSGNSISLNNGTSEAAYYLWSNGETNSTIIIDSSGYYSLTVTDSNYCIGKDTIMVTVSGIAPTVDFLFTEGCTSDTIYFFGIANTLDSIVGWIWNFGDGEVSDQKNPTHVYTINGKYFVSVKVTTISGCANTSVKEIIIYQHPYANFDIEGVCANATCFVENLSSSELSDPIISYFWNFGDGITDTLQTPSHEYISAGFYGISLSVTTNHGCASFLSKQIEVVLNASSPDTPEICFPPNHYCSTDTNIVLRWKPTQNTLFYNVYASTDSLNFQSNLKIISFLRSDSVNIIIKKGSKTFLKVYSFNICGDSVASNVHCYTHLDMKSIQSLYFWLASDTGVVVNDSGDVSLWQDISGHNNNLEQQTNTSKPFFALNQINGYPAVTFNGTTNYLKSLAPFDFSDTRSLTLIAVLRYSLTDVPDRCIYQLGNDFNISSTGFIYFKNSFKTEDLQIKGNIGYNTFRSNKVIDTNFFYNTAVFDKNQDENETHLYKNGQILTGVYANISDNTNNFACDYFYIGYSMIPGMVSFAGEIAEILCFKDGFSNQERNLVEQYIHDKYSRLPICLNPTKFSPYSFCSVQIDAGIGAYNYEWSTGEATQQIEITKSGTYYVTVTDLFGVKSYDSVIVEYPKIPLASKVTFCLGDSVTLHANPGPDYLYKWSKFGIDTISVDSIIQVWQPGTYWVKVQDSLGCFRMDTVVISVDSFPAVASLGGDTAFLCVGDYFGLQVGGDQATEYLWNNGATTPQVQIQDPGLYAVTVTDQNGCTAKDSIFLVLKGLIPQAVFSAGDSVCLGEPILFHDLSHPDPNDTIASIAQWYWDFGDTVTSTTINPIHTYSYPGFHNVSLIVATDSGCLGKTNQPVYVFPLPQPKYFTNTGCNGIAVPFSDQSTCETSKIIGWNWNFDDPASGTSNISYDSATSHTYSAPGSYTVQLAIVTEKGCKDTLIKPLQIVESPTVDFSASNACFGNPVYFVDQTQYQPWSQPTGRIWNFGDGSPVSYLANPMHLFTDSSGYYPVKLTVRTPQCIVPRSKMVLVNPKPIAQFNASDLCVNAPYVFIDLSTITYGSIISRTWIFDTLGISHLTNPELIFSKPGIYNIQLLVNSDQDCVSDTTSYNIEVFNSPVASFSSQVDLENLGYLVLFSNQSSPDAVNFFWDFGDNTSSVTANPQHEYPGTGNYEVYLVSYNQNNCSDTANKKISLTLPSMDVAVYQAQATIDNDKISFNTGISNLGTRTITQLDLKSQVNNGVAINELWTGKLEPGQTIQYTFSSSLQVYQQETLNYYCISAQIPGVIPDANPGNNTICNTFKKEFLVMEPYPSPTKGLLNIDFLLPEAGNVTIEMYDSRGALVQNIYEGSALEGFNKILLSTTNLNRGVYAYKLTFNGNVVVKRFIK